MKHSGTPARLPEFIEPIKATLVGSMPSGDWIYEIKFDGYRALALRSGSETRLLWRNQKDLGSKFPEVKDSIQDAIIDGEIVALDEKGRSSFRLLQSFDMGEERPPIVLYAFDLLQLNGKDLRVRARDRSNIEAIGAGRAQLRGVARGLKEVLITLVLILSVTVFKSRGPNRVQSE